MVAGASSSSAATTRLRSLRWRMTALIAVVAAAAVGILAVVVIRLDRELRDEQTAAELLRRSDDASRAATFENGVMADDPTDGVAGVVVAVNPSFSLAEFERQQVVHGFEDPTDEELTEAIIDAFDDAEPDVQLELVRYALDEEGLDAYADIADIDAVATLVEEGVVDLDPTGGGSADEIVVFVDDVLDILEENPPEELFAEAYRQYVIDTAVDEGVELDFDTRYFTGGPSVIGAETLTGIVDAVVEERRYEFETESQGRLIRATALRDGAQVRGAVIAFVDPAVFDAAHDDLRSRVAALAGALVLAAAVAAWFVAGRSTRPVAVALAQQERFLADAAHELRTPIAAIRATAEAATDETASATIARVAELAVGASTLTDDLLTLARMDADRLEVRRDLVRLDLLVESVVAAEPAAAEAFAVRTEAIVVSADPVLVERAVANLIRNAVDHGGAIASAPATVTVSASGDQATVTVRDHGPGIDTDIAEAVFERFSSRPGSAGHGLGLPLARWIARAHGGDVTIAPAAGGGAALRLTIPGVVSPTA